jgi:P4 family phage/plasmid primase-like protien
MERSSRTKKATIYTFLQDHKAEKGSAFTHTSIYHPIGSFYIPPEDVDRFFELYKEAVLASDDLYLTEKHREIGPVIIDLDFRFEHSSAGGGPDQTEASGENQPPPVVRRRYQKTHIDDVIRIYGNALSSMLSEEVKSFDVYVMEKPAPTLNVDKTVEKDGIHIVIPDIVTNVITQMKLREMVLNPLSDTLVGPLELTNSIADVVDEAVIHRNNWQMLGSKKPHCDMYRVTRIVRYDCTEKTTVDVEQDYIINDNSECQVQFVERLSIRNKYVETQLKTEAVEEIAAYELKMQESKIKSHFKNTILTKTRNCKNNTNEDDMKQAAILVDFLSTARAESYYDWIRVGWCLRNIDHRLLDKWTDFSKKSRKFTEGECDRMWNYMRQDGACLGMGTLHLWARSDSPDEYAKYMATELRTLIRESANGSEYDIARVVHRKYDHLYAYDAASKMWYYFANHRWHHTSEGLALKRKFPTEVAVEYRRAASYYITLANQIEDTAQKNVLDELSTKLQGIVTKLKKAAFQACVMTECIMLFAIDKFEEKLDSNRNLVGFENGVYDLDALEFRDGRPEDFVSLSTGVNYIPYDPVNTTCIMEILAFTRQVITIDRVREYVLRLLASFLHGDIREERFHVWTGSGSNGKSKLLELYQKAYGDYCCTLPIALLTQKRGSSSGASPELARARRKRFACLQEPGENERLNIGLMKEMTGGDTLYARGLYKDGMEFKPQFKMILTCNHLPLVPSDDGGTWRRIRVVRFESKFCENPDPNKPNEFPIDTSLSQKFTDWSEGFMSLLVEYYKKNVTEKIVEPDEVLECTREYQRRNDIIADFLDSAVVKDETGFLQLGEAFNDFKSWLKDEGCTDRSMRKSDFQSYIEKVYGKAAMLHKLKGWRGYKLKSSLVEVTGVDDYD